MNIQQMIMRSPFYLLGLLGLTLFAGDVVAELPFENDGNLYVAMYNSDSYNIFTKSGDPVGTLTTPGLNGPRGLAFNPANGDIWVTGELSNTVYVFDNQHQLRWSLTHPDFNQPVGVSFKMTQGVNAEDQEVYISNSGTHLCKAAQIFLSGPILNRSQQRKRR